MTNEQIDNVLDAPFTNTKGVIENRIVEYIFLLVAKYYELDSTEYVYSKNRKREFVYPRQVSMYLIKHNTTFSLENIGRRYNGKDHSTVTHAIKVINNLMDTEKNVKKDIKYLQGIVKFKSKAIKDDVDIDKDFYYLDFNNYTSIKIKDKKGIILSGFDANEIARIKDFVGGVISSREHYKTGLYILEQSESK